MTIEDDPFSSYFVVRNDRDDYSIWPEVKEVPKGWGKVGEAADKETCLDWIEKNWSGPKLI